MKTQKITITIELPMDSEQANNWVDKQDFVDSTVNEIFNEQIKYKIFDNSGKIETDDEKGNFKIEITDKEEDYVYAKNKKENEAIQILDGLVSDVGNLLCDVADLDFEWQQSGYYETAKKWLLENKS